MIDILVPVLSRPHNVAPLVESIKATTTVAHSIVFLCSLGDDEQIAACREHDVRIEVVPWGAGRSDYPRKMNYGYACTNREFILMGADDLTFLDSWDTRALEIAHATGVGVVGTNDLANRQVMKGFFSTHALVRRSYIRERGAALEGPGILVSESYDHNYCDRELCALAMSRNEWAFAQKSQIKHRHPVWRTERDDATYKKGRQSAIEDQENFYMRCAEWGYGGILAVEQKHLRQTLRKARRAARGKVTRL